MNIFDLKNTVSRLVESDQESKLGVSINKWDSDFEVEFVIENFLGVTEEPKRVTTEK